MLRAPDRSRPGPLITHTSASTAGANPYVRDRCCHLSGSSLDSPLALIYAVHDTYVHVYTICLSNIMTDRLSELSAWEREIQDELLAVSRELEPLISKRDHLQAKLDLVRVLVDLERGATSEGGSEDTRGRARQTTAERIGEAVTEILDDSGEPMHVQEIRAELTSRGVPVPGRGTDANVIVHLSRMPDIFVRTSRGTYGLTKWSG